MVAYELSLLIKAASKNKMVSTVKRTCDFIATNRGYIEKIEFVGTRALPFKISSHGQGQTRGSYFLINYHTPYSSQDEIKDNIKRDVDIIRTRIFPKNIKEEIFFCTLHEETKPPAYRSDVANMIKETEERLPKNLKAKKKREAILKHYIFN